MIIAFLVLGAASLSHLNPSANTVLGPLDKTLSTLRGLFSSAPAITDSHNEKSLPPAGTTVYKWQDAEGNWQFSNTPPPPGVASSTTTYNPDTNVTKAVKPEPPPAEPAAATTESSPSITPLTPYTDPQSVKQLIEDAKNVQQLMDQRQQVLDQNSQGK
jgi:hypothetical protein